jgi:RNA-directed DNA polymerase
MSSNYWSSTTNANNSNNAWCVNFNNGNVNNDNKSNDNYVRAVRSGKCSLLSFRSVYRAYLDCRRRKRGTINALRFEYSLLDNLFTLAQDLQNGTYRPSRSVCFVTVTPKLREIFAADFRDRIVHHLIVRELEKIWEQKFIYDSYASRPGKGIHAAVARLQQFMIKATRNQKRVAWFLQIDVRSFFMSIDKEILFKILEQKLLPREDVESDVLLYLLHRTIFHNCADDYLFKGDPAMLDKVPPHKSLFKVPTGKGLPIGNLTSQFLANVYLNELDQFVKHVLRCRFYIRYVDDAILISPDKEQLCEWEKRIDEFLEKRLALRLKGKGKIKRVSEGSDFLGYIVRPGYILSRKRVVNNLKYKLALFRDKMIQPFQVHGLNVRKIVMRPAPHKPHPRESGNPEGAVMELRQTLASYLGHFKHANTFTLVNSLLAHNSWLREYFIFSKGKLMDRYKYRGVFRSLRAQYLFFRARLENTVIPPHPALSPLLGERDRVRGSERVHTVIFFHMGKFLELYDQDALTIAKPLGLEMRKDFRGMKYVAGFPIWMEKQFISKVLGLGKDLAILDEGMTGRFVKDRHVREIYRVLELSFTET